VAGYSCITASQLWKYMCSCQIGIALCSVAAAHILTPASRCSTEHHAVCVMLHNVWRGTQRTMPATKECHLRPPAHQSPGHILSTAVTRAVRVSQQLFLIPLGLLTPTRPPKPMQREVGRVGPLHGMAASTK
jgi:hypothetical protein